MLNGIIEVSAGEDKGNVEFKIYNPSLNRKKGATLALRKMTGWFDFWGWYQWSKKFYQC